jgi:gluconolactonase
MSVGPATETPWRSVADIDIVMSDVDHVEGIALEPGGALWAGGEAGQVYRAEPGQGPQVIATLPGRTLGVALDADGVAYWCDMTDPGIYRVTAQGKVDLFTQGASDRALRDPNYPAFLPGGILLVTDSGEWKEPNGLIFAVEADGTSHVLTDRAASFPNGLCVSEDGRTVYIVETTASKISAITLDASNAVTGYEDVVVLPGALPDGLALDTDGHLYIGCYVPDAIYALDPDGTLHTVLLDPQRVLVNEPTNVALGTEGDLYFANLGDRHVGRVGLDVTGLPPHRPAFAR